MRTRPESAFCFRGRGSSLPLKAGVSAAKKLMKTISIDIPESAVFPVSASDEDFARGLRLAAAIFWYDKGLISQGKGAEIAGLTRVEFIDALGQANVSAIQTSVEDLKAEKEQAINARR